MTASHLGTVLASAQGGGLAGWAEALVALVGSVLVVELAYRVLGAVDRRLRRHGRPVELLSLVLAHSKHAAWALAFSIAGAASVHLGPASARTGLSEWARVALILSITWVAVAASRILWALTRSRIDAADKDGRDARRAVTQLGLVHRVLNAVIVVIGGLAAVTSLPEVRTVGASLLASAGVLGIVAGIAGQSTLGNVIAGLQVAFSGALRLDDVVVVEGAWGTIEQITLTYVVVKIWDERRLVLPVSYFVSNAFENWTRTGSQLLGTIYFFVDFSVPVDEIRQELLRFVGEHPLWDRRAAGLVVTDATNSTVQLRALVSSANSSDNWDLRCAVREHLVEYLRDHYPDALPRLRLRMAPGPDGLATGTGIDGSAAGPAGGPAGGSAGGSATP